MDKLIKELRIYGELTVGVKYNIVVLYPLADESTILERLGLTPKDCTSCDLYWVWKGKGFFVSLWGHQDEHPMVNYHKNKKQRTKFRHSFNVFTNKSPISTSDAVKVLDVLSSYMSKCGKSLKKVKPEQIVRITDTDICLNDFKTNVPKK